jgi:pantoate--beta-alanine ligase
MKVIHSPVGMQKQSAKWVRSGEKAGFVPTMGALHDGHLSLLRQARRECDVVVASIYVNPTQFGPKEDFSRYPRPLRADLALCRAAGVDYVFAPANLYLPDHSTFVDEEKMSRGRDGSSRPGHFRGVATVVLKLFNLVRPTRAYFGQKDAQQVDVIRRMTRDLHLPVRIVVGKTIRDPDGVALSSRNRYLSATERIVAAQFAKMLQEAARRGRSAAGLEGELRRISGLRVDYVAAVEGRLCAAVFVGKTRLIDNEQIKREPLPKTPRNKIVGDPSPSSG